jgi:hypothetical protein
MGLWNPQLANGQSEPRPFYKYVKASAAKKILITRKLRWSSPLLFNDPFDVSQELRLDFDETALQSALSSRLAEIAEQGTGGEAIRHPILKGLMQILTVAPEEKRKTIAEELRDVTRLRSKEQPRAIAELRETWASLVPDFRILCLSTRQDIARMWFSYAEDRKGVALEFSVFDESSPFSLAQPVIYQDEPPSVANVESWVSCLLKGDRENYLDLFRELMYVKTTDWASEEEWRIVSSSRPGEKGLFGDYGFHPKELKAIFFGSECSAEDQADLLKMLVYGLEHVTPYRAYPNIKRTKFAFQRLDRNGNFLP